MDFQAIKRHMYDKSVRSSYLLTKPEPFSFSQLKKSALRQQKLEMLRGE